MALLGNSMMILKQPLLLLLLFSSFHDMRREESSSSSSSISSSGGCFFTLAFQTSPAFYQKTTLLSQRSRALSPLSSSFYDDFENFDNEDDDDDDDDDDDAKMMAALNSRMGSLFGSDDLSTDDDEEDDDDDDDDDDDEYYEESTSAASMSGKTISSVDDLISFANAQSKDQSSTQKEAQTPTEWATPLVPPKSAASMDDISSSLKAGAVLIANPAKFCSDFGGKKSNIFSQPSPALLAKFGLTLPPPADLGPDRRADLLPVLVLLERDSMKGCQAVLMNRRTGYLLGDLEQQQQQQQESSDESTDASAAAAPPKLGAFMIQPLWFGGTSAGGNNDGTKSSNSGGSNGGLDMLHLCPLVEGAVQLTEDGLYWGGDPEQAQEAMNDPSLGRVMTGFDFKFFVQSTRWLPEQLEREIKDGTWFVASVSKEVLFKSRDRLGTKRAKPLWTEIMELMGEDYATIRDLLYDDN